jgi:hypothetical protein
MSFFSNQIFIYLFLQSFLSKDEFNRLSQALLLNLLFSLTNQPFYQLISFLIAQLILVLVFLVMLPDLCS